MKLVHPLKWCILANRFHFSCSFKWVGVWEEWYGGSEERSTWPKPSPCVLPSCKQGLPAGTVSSPLRSQDGCTAWRCASPEHRTLFSIRLSHLSGGEKRVVSSFFAQRGVELCWQASSLLPHPLQTARLLPPGGRDNFPVSMASHFIL